MKCPNCKKELDCNETRIEKPNSHYWELYIDCMNEDCLKEYWVVVHPSKLNECN